MKFLVICIRPYSELSDVSDRESGNEMDDREQVAEQQYFKLNKLLPVFFTEAIFKQRANGEPLFQYKFCMSMDEASNFLKLCDIEPHQDYSIEDGYKLMEANINHVVLEVLDSFDPDTMKLADYVLHYYILKPEGFVYPALIRQCDAKRDEIQFLEEQCAQLQVEQFDYDSILSEMALLLTHAKNDLADLEQRVEALLAEKYQVFVNRELERQLANPTMHVSVSTDPRFFSRQLGGGGNNNNNNNEVYSSRKSY